MSQAKRDSTLPFLELVCVSLGSVPWFNGKPKGEPKPFWGPTNATHMNEPQCIAGVFPPEVMIPHQTQGQHDSGGRRRALLANAELLVHALRGRRRGVLGGGGEVDGDGQVGYFQFLPDRFIRPSQPGSPPACDRQMGQTADGASDSYNRACCDSCDRWDRQP